MFTVENYLPPQAISDSKSGALKRLSFVKQLGETTKRPTCNNCKRTSSASSEAGRILNHAGGGDGSRECRPS